MDSEVKIIKSEKKETRVKAQKCSHNKWYKYEYDYVTPICVYGSYAGKKNNENAFFKFNPDDSFIAHKFNVISIPDNVLLEPTDRVSSVFTVDENKE